MCKGYIYTHRLDTVLFYIQGLEQPKNDNDYHFWAPKRSFFSLPLFPKTVKIKNFDLKWHNCYSEVGTQRMLHLKTKLIF